MSVTVWLDTGAEKTIELGGVIPVYKLFAELAAIVGDGPWVADYPSLSGVINQTETQEDAGGEWLDDVRGDAQSFLDAHAGAASAPARSLLRQLIGEIGAFRDSEDKAKRK